MSESSHLTVTSKENESNIKIAPMPQNESSVQVEPLKVNEPQYQIVKITRVNLIDIAKVKK